MCNNSITNEELGARLRALRKQCGLSIRQAERLLGYSKSQISNLERGNCTISAQQLYFFSRAYQVKIESFFEEIDGCAADYSECCPQFLALSQLDGEFSEFAGELIDQVLALQEKCRSTNTLCSYKG